jgi:uncharacterized protein (TIGR04255 family)
MTFPDAPRVIYNKNPLDRVICQLRFPAILRIQNEIPAEFQEHIRKDFPGFVEKNETIFSIQQEKKTGSPGQLPQPFLPVQNKNYEFSSEDGNWTVNLTRSFLALTTRKYTRRNDFQERLQIPLQALVSVYKPAYFSRVGLRYIDIIKRSVLNLEGAAWKDLLQPYILGLLSSDVVNQNIKNAEAKYEVLLDDNKSIARIVTGLVESQENRRETCFMIDTDFYNTDRTEITEAKTKLDYFHVRASRLIQWLIQNRLHEAMEPMEPEKA